MAYDFSQFKEKIKEIEEWLAREIASVRTGRATPAILDAVKVESYGAKVPINHIAGVSTEDAKTIKITPWDKGQVKAIESAIAAANLGLSLATDDRGLRVIFPELTGERREALLKIVNSKHEEARVSLKHARDEVWNDLQEKEKSGSMSEDDKFRYKEEMEKLVDSANKTLEERTDRKEAEISS